MKNQKGITLVALIITIIVMLILAGVSISLVVGDSGVLTQAQNTKYEQEKAEFQQAIELAYADVLMTYYSNTGAGSALYADNDTLIDAIAKNSNNKINATVEEGSLASSSLKLSWTGSDSKVYTATISATNSVPYKPSSVVVTYTK